MTNRWVLNASPIIVLARIGQEGLLQALPKGTLAVVLQAKQAGLVPSAADILRRLVASGFRLDDTVIRESLARTVGEEWY